MNRIDARFKVLKEQSRSALVPYVTAGDPQPGVTVSLMHAMVEGGADLIELGVPFSDPMADGPVIQAACERALEYHVSLTQVLGMVSEFRQTNNDTPVVLMGYLNPIEVMGYETFAKTAAEAGVDGVLTVDLPPEEGADFMKALAGFNIAPIFLLSPTSTAERIAKITHEAKGFVYYVSLKGVTGVKSIDIGEVSSKVAQLREHTALPIGVGFGIKDAETAKAVAKVADAVVVGSSIVKRIEALKDTPEKINADIAVFLKDLRQAMDSTTHE